MEGTELEHHTPKAVPPEVLAYDSPLAQLGVGKAGKLGALVLRLEQDKSNGKTSVKDQYSRVPLYTQRALYLEEAPNTLLLHRFLHYPISLLRGIKAETKGRDLRQTEVNNTSILF